MKMDAIKQAQQMHRQVLEATYDGTFTACEYRRVRNDQTKLMESGEVIYLTDQPCRLSYKTVTVAREGGGAVEVAQSVKLFCAPELAVKAGSKLAVTREGITVEYKNSGVPAIYASHQEIPLELFRGWA